MSQLCCGLAIALLIAFATSCKSQSQAEVAGVWIAQAESTVPLPKGKTIAMNRGSVPTDLGTEPDVKLAIARDVRWSSVRDLRKELLAKGRVPHLVVADGRKVGAFNLYDDLEGETIKVYVSFGGKLCVEFPNSREAKCVQRRDRTHVDRAITRELVREAVKAYGLHDVLIDVPADLEWADVVRAVDGSRTCCFETIVRARLK
ncbi:MAG: hypothetical protein GY811_25435 [Myxococcales bacterium]|nr:hypothetical protein [Myxococcales bacterium]